MTIFPFTLNLLWSEYPQFHPKLNCMMRSVRITCFFKCGLENSILNAQIDINMIVDDLFTKNFKSVKFGSHVESERS